MYDNHCNNCGKQGHVFHQCNVPITSLGVVLFRDAPEGGGGGGVGGREYLMIRRKDTLGFIDFMRGKYAVNNKGYILNMLKQMTNDEKHALCTMPFADIWRRVWGENALPQYRSEELVSSDKFAALTNGVYVRREFYTLASLVSESNTFECWEEPEWGFPKGRRNHQEKDYACAMREMTEETGYSAAHVQNVMNLLPFEEIFTGSNYKSYKHKYFVARMTRARSQATDGFEKTEVSAMAWMTLEECLRVMRPYNIEKKRVLCKIDAALEYFAGNMLQ